MTKAIRDQLNKRHNTFIFARTGGVHGQRKLETKGYWDVPNLTTFEEYNIPHSVIREWIQTNQLDVIVFNEEYDWSLVKCCKDTGAKVITYLDYYKDEWQQFMQLYDGVLCSSRRAYDLVKGRCKAHYMGWGVDTELFAPTRDDAGRCTFFHNAGWFGINYRKMTPAAILAFDAVNQIFPDISLFVHSQADLEKLPQKIVEIVRANKNIHYHVETVSAPGLYHKGRILLFPTKLEGLGLPLFEAFSCGLPAIVTDAPPMNEFVENGCNGVLAKVAHRFARQDNIAFPEEIIDMNDLAMKMAIFAENQELIGQMSRNAREYALAELNLPDFSDRINSCLEAILEESVAL